MEKRKLVMLAIIDGYGISDNAYGNAIKASSKPTLDYLCSSYPNTLINASGEDVGLPDGQMGNSEVGHINIGAGRIVYQSLTKVNISVRNDELIKKPAIKKAINHCIKNNSKLHIMGLLSDGGVHSHINHILYLLEKGVQSGVKEVIVHAFLDGRDVNPKSSLLYLNALNKKIKEVGNSKIGIISGRYYIMDRDKNWERVQKGYDILVKDSDHNLDYESVINNSYASDITDEFIVPFKVSENSHIEENDSVIFANFRPDRAIQIATSLTNLSKTSIVNGIEFKNLVFVSMMKYSDNVLGEVVFENQELKNIFGEYVSSLGLSQLRIAETEKYAHVTYFFDGGIDLQYENCDRILVQSPKVDTFDQAPEMSAEEVTVKVIDEIKKNKYDCIILNYANCDMVGHTANMEATIKAVEKVDSCLKRVYEEVKKVDGILIIIADHGNADKLLDENGAPFSAHTTNPVPCIITKKGIELKNNGNLGDVVPTMFDLMGIKKPDEMTGESLIKK